MEDEYTDSVKISGSSSLGSNLSMRGVLHNHEVKKESREILAGPQEA